MKILKKKKIDTENISKKKFNIERINENIMCNEISIDNFSRTDKINYDMKAIDDTKLINLEEFKALKEVEIEKENKTKIIGVNNNNLSHAFSLQKSNSQKKNVSNNINIKPTNTYNINKIKEFYIDKLEENHEPKRKNNVTEKNWLYLYIIMILFIFIKTSSYISKIKNNLNYDLNFLFIFGFYISKCTNLSNKYLEQTLIIQHIDI